MNWDKFEKLVSLVREKLTTIILYRLKDPRIGFVTVTRVELSRDLKTCSVYYSVFGKEGEKSKTSHALEAAKGYIQSEIAKALRTKTVPQVRFIFDEGMDKADRVFRILKEIETEKENNGDSDEAARPEDEER